MPTQTGSISEPGKVALRSDFNPVFDNAPAGLYRSSVSGGHILQCNKCLATMLGYSTVQTCMDEYRFGEHYVDSSRRPELLRHVRAYGEVKDFQADLTRADGEVISVIFNARLFSAGGYLEGVMVDVSQRRRALEDLRRQREMLDEKNIALRELLDKVEEQRRRIAEGIYDNIQHNLLPLIDRIDRRADDATRPMVRQLLHELEDITAPFTQRLSRACDTLTPAELRISNLIRRGLSSKEIAATEGISAGTVSVHREHIRRKLNLTNTKANLATYLQKVTENNAPSFCR